MTARTRHHEDALCVPATRTIYISRKSIRWGPAQRLGVIIHEVCHAVQPSSGHGESWMNRMALAAARAAERGDEVLAQWLRAEVRRYQTPPDRLGANATYREIRDFVRESSTLPPFEAMVEEFSRSRSMTPALFLGRYPRARKVYNSGIPGKPRRPGNCK